MADPTKKKYSNALKHTLVKDPLIETVYFDGKGNHHFNAYDGGDGQKYFGIDVVTSPIKGKEGTFKEVRVGRRGTQLIANISADEILEEAVDMSEPGAEEVAFDIQLAGRGPKKSKKKDKDQE